MRLLSAYLKYIVVNCGTERLICRRAVHKRMARRVNQASLIRNENLERRSKVLWQYRQQIQEERSRVIRQEGQ